MHLKELRFGANEGVSLVELLIGLSLLGLVFSMAYLIFNYGINTYDITELQITLQQEVRMASRMFSEEIRFARSLELLDSVPVNLTTGENFVYVKDNKLIHVTGGTERVYVDPSGEGDLKIDFELVDDKQVNFKISLESKKRNKNRAFDLESSVIPLNFSDFSSLTLKESSVLKYSLH